MSRSTIVAGFAVAALAGVISVVTVLRPAMAHGTFAAGEPGDPTKPARVIEVIAREDNGGMSYTPSRIEVRRGEQIRFVVKNEGELSHEFLLDSFEGNAKHKLQMEKHPEMEHDDPNGKRLEPKTSAEILWRFTKAGTFEFACLIPGHYQAGMKGEVVVAAGKPKAGK